MNYLPVIILGIVSLAATVGCVVHAFHVWRK